MAVNDLNLQQRVRFGRVVEGLKLALKFNGVAGVPVTKREVEKLKL